MDDNEITITTPHGTSTVTGSWRVDDNGCLHIHARDVSGLPETIASFPSGGWLAVTRNDFPTPSHVKGNVS